MGKLHKVRSKQFCDTSKFDKFYTKSLTLNKKVTIADLENQFETLNLPKDWYIVNDSIIKVGKKFIVQLSDKPKSDKVWEHQDVKMLLVVTKMGYVILICKSRFLVSAMNNQIKVMPDMHTKAKTIKIEQNLVVNEY